MILVMHMIGNLKIILLFLVSMQSDLEALFVGILRMFTKVNPNVIL